jgi:hypothetical protein
MVMTESEILNNLEFVIGRLLDLKEWDSSKKIQQIRNYIVEKSSKEESVIPYEEVLPNQDIPLQRQIHSFLMAAG